MSKKRAHKSKRRRESHRPSAGTPNASAPKEPRLKLITGGEAGVSGVRVAANAAEIAEPAAEIDREPPPVSEPPASVEDLEEEARFFHEGRIQTPHAFAVAEDLDVDAEARKPSPKMSAAAQARRAHFSKYVKGAMVAATAILTLAGIRVLVGRSDRVPDAYATTALAAPPPVAAPVETKPVESQPVEAKPVEAKPVEPTPVAEKPVEAKPVEPVAQIKPAPAPTPEAAKPVETKPAEPPPAPVAEASGKTAAQEKAEARRLLERGKSGLAIEAGERSVALDPTDGEAWLILGAAYQDKGNLKDARRAFQACTKQGKRGPIGECRAMLQQ